MKDCLTVSINDRNVIEYDRRQRLPGKQRRFLEQMDQDMSAGIKLGSTTITEPDAFTRVQYVTMRLLHACEKGDPHMQAAMCAYLSTRSPNLDKIVASKHNDEMNIEFIFADQD